MVVRNVKLHDQSVLLHYNAKGLMFALRQKLRFTTAVVEATMTSLQGNHNLPSNEANIN